MKIATHLFFDGTCREAMNFYQSCLGGTVNFNTVGELPAEAKAGMPLPVNSDKKIIHSSLEKDGITLLSANDMMDPSSFIKGDNFSVGIECESEEEIKDLFKKLSAGGKIHMGLEDVFWGAIFGSFTDKFGVDWMLNYTKPKK